VLLHRTPEGFERSAPALHLSMTTPALHPAMTAPALHLPMTASALHPAMTAPALHLPVTAPALHLSVTSPALHLFTGSPALHSAPPSQAAASGHSLSQPLEDSAAPAGPSGLRSSVTAHAAGLFELAVSPLALLSLPAMRAALRSPCPARSQEDEQNGRQKKLIQSHFISPNAEPVSPTLRSPRCLSIPA
jgi:hypothetical protein